MKCDKCLRDFEERLLDCSHDIPKYMGGTDLDDRHWLCKSCHKKYELQVLANCLKVLGVEINFEKPPRYYMALIKTLENNSKKICRKIAKEQREVFFNG